MKVLEQNASRVALGGRMMWLIAAALSVGILAGCGAGANGPKNAISGVFSGENGHSDILSMKTKRKNIHGVSIYTFHFLCKNKLRANSIRIYLV